MHVVVTRAKLKEGMAGDCARLFKDTNPDLVRDEPDWLGARMLFDPETQMVTVLAHTRGSGTARPFVRRCRALQTSSPARPKSPSPRSSST